MTKEQLAVVLVGVVLIALAVCRAPRVAGGAAASVLAAVVGLPFALVVAAPLAPEEAAKPLPSHPSAQPATTCRVIPDRKRAGDRPRYTVRPAECHQPGDGMTTYVLDRTAIRSSGGDELRLVPGWVTGFVERSEATGRRGQVDGWAASEKAHLPAGRVLVFINGRFVVAVKPTINRPDVARARNLRREKAGFSFELPLADLARTPELKMTLIAVQGGRASRLPLDCEGDPVPFGC